MQRPHSDLKATRISSQNPSRVGVKSLRAYAFASARTNPTALATLEMWDAVEPILSSKQITKQQRELLQDKCLKSSTYPRRRISAFSRYDIKASLQGNVSSPPVKNALQSDIFLIRIGWLVGLILTRNNGSEPRAPFWGQALQLATQARARRRRHNSCPCASHKAKTRGNHK